MSKTKASGLLRVGIASLLVLGFWMLASFGFEWVGTAEAQTVPSPPGVTPGPVDTISPACTPTPIPPSGPGVPPVPCIAGISLLVLLLILLGVLLLRRRKEAGA